MSAKSISGVVREVLDESEIALSALRAGILNLSAYGKEIRAEVSRRAKRDVALGTIVVALSRYEIDVGTRRPLCPKIRIESISTRSALAEVTFNKTSTARAKLRAIYEQKKLIDADFLTVTSGMREISIIAPAELVRDISSLFKGERPTSIVSNLAGITLRFSPDYQTTPNSIFAMLRPLALNHINLVEVVSTYTELTVVVAQKDLQATFAVFSKLPSA